MEILLSKEFYYRVNEGDSLQDICLKFNTSVDNILRNNLEIPLYAGEWIKITQNEYVVHIVKPTETIDKIANEYNVNVKDLLVFNNLENEKLFIGQQLKIFLKQKTHH